MITVLSYTTGTVQTKNGTQMVLRMKTQEYPDKTVSAFAGAWSQGLKAGDKIEGTVSTNGEYLNFKPADTGKKTSASTNNADLVAAIKALTKAIEDLPTKLNVAKVFTQDATSFPPVEESEAFPQE